MPDYPNLSIRYLQALNQYQFLTVRQFARLGFGNENTIRNRLREFRERKKAILGRFEGYKKPQRNTYSTKLHDLYYMTQYGAKELEDFLGLDDDNIAYRKCDKPPESQYFHHVNTIDFQIETEAFCHEKKVDLRFFHTYLDRTGSNRNSPITERLKSKTRMEIDLYGKKTAFIPDVIFQANANEKFSSFYTAEIYNGYSTQRVLNQLKKHIFALEQGALSTTYKLDVGWRVLVVFDQEAAMRAVMRRAKDTLQIENPNRFFIFNTLDRLKGKTTDETIKKDPFNCSWLHADGTKARLFIQRR